LFPETKVYASSLDLSWLAEHYPFPTRHSHLTVIITEAAIEPERISQP